MLDYESLSPDDCSGLDMFIMESIVQDHSDSTYLDWSVSTKWKADFNGFLSKNSEQDLVIKHK